MGEVDGGRRGREGPEQGQKIGGNKLFSTREQPFKIYAKAIKCVTKDMF